MDRKRYVGMSLLGALALAACSPRPAEPPKPDPAGISTTLRWHEVNIEDRTDVGDPWNLRKPAAGALYVIVRYTATNDGETRLPVSAMPKVRLLDPNGRAVYPDPDATTVFRSEVNSGVEKTREGDLNPGVSARQGVVFELGQDAWKATGWRFQVGDDPAQSGPISKPSAQPAT